MQTILLFGAGKSATVLIQYLLRHAAADNYRLIIADANIQLLQSKLNNHPAATGLHFSVEDEAPRKECIATADVVISLLPPYLHRLIAVDCLAAGKHLLTASYVDEEMEALDKAVKDKGLLFLCEMGLDPGIDHMSAAEMIASIRAKGGNISSFYSHCGGLVAPESDDNPWRYKISWNPRNVVLAGKAGARFIENGEEVQLSYPQLFAEQRPVHIRGCEDLCWYPNRDSVSYAPLFGLEHCKNFIRTTLRHADFMWGWKNIIELKLTDENVMYDTKEKSLAQFFKEYLDAQGFGDWLQQKMTEQIKQSSELLQNLIRMMDLEKNLDEDGQEEIKEFMQVGRTGDLEAVHLDDVKTAAAATVAQKMHNAKLTLSQLFYLGLSDDETKIKGDKNSAAGVLQQALEQKLTLLPTDKDRVVMMHEIKYSIGNKEFCDRGTLVIDGEDGERTAMAKTVGLPLGIAARAVIKNEITERGVLLPLSPNIYTAVLAALAEEGIRFEHETTEL